MLLDCKTYYEVRVSQIKEGICCDEHRMMYGSVESLNFIPETNITLYINQLEFK